MTAILPDLSLEEIAAWASENGFEMLKVCAWPVSGAGRRYAGVTHIEVNALTQQKAKAILALMDQHKLEISSLVFYPNPLHPDPDHREMVIEHLKQVILVATSETILYLLSRIILTTKRSPRDAQHDLHYTSHPDHVRQRCLSHRAL